MSRYQRSHQVFRSFNWAIMLVFIAITVIAIGLTSFRYYQQLQAFKVEQLDELKHQTELLDNKMALGIQTLAAMKQYAEYFLQHPEELNIKAPPLVQQGDAFYLHVDDFDIIEKRYHLGGNITGLGQLDDFDQAMKQELTMASGLVPGFINAQKTLPEATWFYYLSANKFVNLYPWVSKRSWRYNENMSGQQFFSRFDQTNPDQVLWSVPYLDGAGTGMSISLATGVYHQDQLKGVLIIDFRLAELANLLTQNLNQHDLTGRTLVLLDQEQHVLWHADNNLTSVQPSVWQKLVPDSLKHITNQDLLANQGNWHQNDYVVQTMLLPQSQWLLVSYQSQLAFISPVLKQFALTIMTVLAGLTIFLTLVYYLSLETFIRPTKLFIRHIEHCADGDPGKIKPTNAWLPWFVIVENIFGENRALLQQLKEQNQELDRRVDEKTEQLQLTSIQREQDYARLKSVMNAMPELILFSDNHCCLIGVNQAFEKFIGLPSHQLLGTNIDNKLPSTIAEVLAEHRSLTPDHLGELTRTISANNSHYQVYCSYFFTEKGELLGSVNIIRDVTEQYQSQVTIVAAKEQAENANRAKSQFLANMSHEIRTPINAIQGMMQLLMRTPVNHLQQQYLDNAVIAAGNLLHLIDGLLDLTRVESGKMELVKGPCLLDNVLANVVQLNIQQVLKKQLNLTIHCDNTLPELVDTDEMRLIQVLSNLVNNAIKFTHHGGIDIKLEFTGNQGQQALVRFSVEDTGIGIAKAKQEGLFEAFSQVDQSMTRQYGGSGLGLSICRQIVTLLGGDIRLDSTLGQGSAFSFVLPMTVLPLTALPDGEQSLHLEHIEFGQIEQVLPANLQAFIESHSHCRQYSIAQVNTGLSEQSKTDVVFVDIERLDGALSNDDSASIDLEQLTTWLQKQDVLLAICQAAVTDYPEQILTWLERAQLNYVFIEKPLYRGSLRTVLQTYHNKKSPLATPTEVSETAADDSVSPPVNNIDRPKDKAGASVSDHQVEVAQSKGGYNQAQVLLVEDNLINQLVAKELLQALNAQVTIVDNGEKAIAAIQEYEFDLVFMDIQMPVMDGLTAVKRIRAMPHFNGLPVVAMTAHAREEDQAMSLAAGMNLHIAKPITADKLQQVYDDLFKG